MFRVPFLVTVALCVASQTHAQTETSTSNTVLPDLQLPTFSRSADPAAVEEPVDRVTVTGKTQRRARIAGSAYVIDEAELEIFEDDDVHQILGQVPGVYVRGEDGYGLRPNIGLRGASSDRSAKVALTEDGVLLAPAPYAAPAAYFFPLMTRMTSVDVFKGPAAIRSGPNTIGGAINFRTRAPPERTTAFFDISGGSQRSGKLHAYLGTGSERWGVLIEGVRLQTDGFKQLDSGANTGFAKNEFMLRARYRTDPTQRISHQWDLKLGYSDEVSNETYLGLTEADFAENPRRRYPSTELGLMDWNFNQARADYTLNIADFELRATLYRRGFSRSWRKLNNFKGGPTLTQILDNPTAGQAAVFYDVLRGAADTSTDQEILLIGDNARSYVSQGIDLKSSLQFETFGVRHALEVGVRLHNDRVERDHDEADYAMQSGVLVPRGGELTITADNRGEAWAIATYVRDELSFGDLLVTPGLRIEHIRRKYIDRLRDNETSGNDTILIPGIGAYYQATKWLGVLAGVYRGFSPVSPGQPDGVSPETSINYEAGARLDLTDTQTRAELIGFFNNYENLTGECTFSSGCDPTLLNQQFNAGSVHVYGLEALLEQQVDLAERVKARGRIAYTFTMSDFQTGFSSPFPQFGTVEPGDQLAYVPQHQGSLTAGVFGESWSADVSVRHVGRMRDSAGQGDFEKGTAAYTVVDLAGSYQFWEPARVYATVDNLFDTVYVASLRPYGARPGLPFRIIAGLKIEL